MQDQRDELRSHVWHRAAFGPAGAAAPMIVVGGGKSGVGTTTIAVNLAVAMARQGRRAVFVDADLERGGRALFGSPAVGSIVDILAGRRSVHETLDRGPFGIQVLCGAWTSAEAKDFSAVVQNRMICDLKNLAPHAELIVVDAGNGRSPFAERLWQAASAVVAVTTPDDAAITQCYVAIKSHVADQPGLPIHTFVNLAREADGASDVHARLAEACRRFLGRRTIAIGQVEACDETTGPTCVFPTRWEGGRVLDRAADALWSHLHETTAAAPVRRAASN